MPTWGGHIPLRKSCQGSRADRDAALAPAVGLVQLRGQEPRLGVQRVGCLRDSTMKRPLRELVVVAFHVSFFFRIAGVLGGIGTHLPG